MKYQIGNQPQTRHRDTCFTEYVEVEDVRLRFDDVEVFVVRLHKDKKWWIIPCSYDDDEKLPDNGPYDDVGDALLMLRLIGEE